MNLTTSGSVSAAGFEVAFKAIVTVKPEQTSESPSSDAESAQKKSMEGASVSEPNMVTALEKTVPAGKTTIFHPPSAPGASDHEKDSSEILAVKPVPIPPLPTVRSDANFEQKRTFEFDTASEDSDLAPKPKVKVRTQRRSKTRKCKAFVNSFTPTLKTLKVESAQPQPRLSQNQNCKEIVKTQTESNPDSFGRIFLALKGSEEFEEATKEMWKYGFTKCVRGHLYPAPFSRCDVCSPAEPAPPIHFEKVEEEENKNEDDFEPEL